MWACEQPRSALGGQRGGTRSCRSPGPGKGAPGSQAGACALKRGSRRVCFSLEITGKTSGAPESDMDWSSSDPVPRAHPAAATAIHRRSSPCVRRDLFTGVCVLFSYVLTITATRPGQECSLKASPTPGPIPCPPHSHSALLPGLRAPTPFFALRPASLHLSSSRPQAAPHRPDSSLNCFPGTARRQGSAAPDHPSHLLPQPLLGAWALRLPLTPRPFPESGTHLGAPRGAGAACGKTEQPCSPFSVREAVASARTTIL